MMLHMRCCSAHLQVFGENSIYTQICSPFCFERNHASLGYYVNLNQTVFQYLTEWSSFEVFCLFQRLLAYSNSRYIDVTSGIALRAVGSQKHFFFA